MIIISLLVHFSNFTHNNQFVKLSVIDMESILDHIKNCSNC